MKYKALRPPVCITEDFYVDLVSPKSHPIKITVMTERLLGYQDLNFIRFLVLLNHILCILLFLLTKEIERQF